MAYVNNVGLSPIVITNNGSESIVFSSTDVIFKEEDVSFATEYFNPVTGIFDNSKSTLYFESGETLVLDQAYAVTMNQLLALN